MGKRDERKREREDLEEAKKNKQKGHSPWAEEKITDAITRLTHVLATVRNAYTRHCSFFHQLTGHRKEVEG